MSDTNPLPLGKLPPDLLARILTGAPVSDPRVLLGAGPGLDCAVVDPGGDGGRLLVFKTEPITFATAQIGWYSVQVSVNDIATSGAEPRWYLMTLLLPQERTTPSVVQGITQQVYSACQELGISVIGGHTEVTYGLERPILIATLVGEVERSRLVTPRGAVPGDRLLLSKGVPIEATAILSREFPDRLEGILSSAELEQAQRYLFEPGISILRDARLAVQAGHVHAMHDPTEGGLAAALWELAEASGRSLHFDPHSVPVPALALRICRAFKLDPLATIASGALLLAAPAEDARNICQALGAEGIPCAEIGRVEEGPAEVWAETHGKSSLLTRPLRDEITRVYA